MNESTLESVGQTLRAAREAKGMSLDDAAMRLRLMHRQVEAMEADDFESLGQPVFARGFVRNYARLLGVAPESLLTRMQGAPAEPAPVSQSEPPLPRSWLSSPWLILLLLALLLLVAAPVALYLWLNSEVEEGPASQAVSSAPARPAAAEVPAPAATLPDGTSPPAEAATTESAAGGAAAASEPAASGAAEAGEPAAPEPQAASSVLHLEFGAEAWTEVKDASGRMLHRQLDAAGSSADISGQPPFDVVIGNASQVRLTYNGRPIDLKPFTDGTVARFTLEE